MRIEWDDFWYVAEYLIFDLFTFIEISERFQYCYKRDKCKRALL